MSSENISGKIDIIDIPADTDAIRIERENANRIERENANRKNNKGNIVLVEQFLRLLIFLAPSQLLFLL